MSRRRRPAPRDLPRATYRVQLNCDFTFHQAAGIISYLERLGISHVYCSPYLAARPGSRHGYDITNHADFNPELGGRTGFEAFAAALQGHGMGHILDFVPNHMGVGHGDNPWWLDVLEWGRASPFASFFDIDWEPIKPELQGKVMLPFLGDHYGNVLEAGDLKLAFHADEGAFAIHYHEHRTPIAPRHYARILGEALAQLRIDGDAADAGQPLAALRDGFAGVTAGVVSGQARQSRRAHVIEMKAALAKLADEEPRARAAIEAAVAVINGTPGDPASFAALHRLIEGQAYRLCYWRVAADEINYRRFFDVNDLASIRVESQDVFAAVHSLAFSLIESGKLQGLRIDHVDGLYDPFSYCRRVRTRLDTALRRAGARRGGYLVVEKILAESEDLPAEWPVDGTTGYDFMNEVLGLFVDRHGRGALNRVYREFIKAAPSYGRILYDSKKYVMKNMLASELQVLALELDRIAKANWRTRDMTLSTLRDALAEVVAEFPVYRTYITGGGASEADRRYIRAAVDAAARDSILATEVFEFIHDVLTTDLVRENRAGYSRGRVIRFAMKFQQYSSPVMAKGAEDTAFYRFHRLTALNEVGGDPRRVGVAIAEFHQRNAARADRWPGTMLATMTHDAKRGEDMRARLAALSEIADDWIKKAILWRRINRRAKPRIDLVPAPEPNDEYLLYQTLVASWPIAFTGQAAPPADALAAYRARLQEYMVKAIREAKTRSAWIRPDASYEEAMARFIERLLDPVTGAAFLAEFVPFQERIARLGVINGLAQTLLRLTCPGVPDTYQGSELWDLRLVDPDNRRAVDYARRVELLDELERTFAHPGNAEPRDLARELALKWQDGAVKLFVIWRALALRRANPELFARGSYVPLRTEGPLARQLCGYARIHNGGAALVVVPRLIAGVGGEDFAALPWSDTRIFVNADTNRPVFRNVFTDERFTLEPRRGGGGALPAQRLFAHFPIALLAAEPAGPRRRGA
jgi:(1->4)-alpha-D-glucan 1-alpha-D-glucosylmutase